MKSTKPLKKTAKQGIEKRAQLRLQQSTGGRIEVVCKSGVIDVLTSTQVIEVKQARLWKAAIGQALVYRLEYPLKQARVHLCGECSPEFEAMVMAYGCQLGVVVTFDSGKPQLVKQKVVGKSWPNY